MASLSSSPIPSSSAVTIPIPGKSILKRPPQSQQSFLSRIKGFLPTQAASLNNEPKPLKRAHFILPQIATVYPISSVNPPSTPTLKEEKKAIEEREAERRKRVVRGNSTGPGPNETEEWWNMDKVESFYRECCASREERPDPAISAAFKNASGTHPRSVDLSGAQLTVTSAAILSDVFTIEWGLRKVVFRECNLDDLMLKPMLHALLIPDTLSFLSVASNRRLKAPAYRVIGAYMAKAKTLQFLDLSQNPLDKKSIEYIVAALAIAPEPGLVSLRLDDCSLRPAALEALSRSVRTSSLRNISLRHNRINATGAVALALMIRDYPDIVTAPNPSPTLPLSPASSIINSPPSLPNTTSPKSVPITLPPPPPGRAGLIPPPPRHPTSSAPQTTYTPYIPRSRRGPPVSTPDPLSSTGQPIPIITSSAQGGVTTRHPVTQSMTHGQDTIAQPKHVQGPSAALLDKVRALDTLPRLGALRTLDLKGNDLRGGITYVAQVLKRNRTLKVLNLSENKLDVQCLVAIAEALKYNSCLETLDLSKNPCSGPELEGIQSLRTAFTLNTALKRLFLSSTQMTSAGAIALAEFLPESMALLHLDLTLNNIDIAGVMALSSGLKANHTMRCLDLNIPPGDDEFARMCRDILSSCVRNTEEAEKNFRSPDSAAGSDSGRGLGKGVWGMIDESELAKRIRQGEGKKGDLDVIIRARISIAQLEKTLSSASPPASPFSSTLSTPTMNESPGDAVIMNAKTVVLELGTIIQKETSSERMEELLSLCDHLNLLLGRVTRGRLSKLQLEGLGLKLGDMSVVDGNAFTNGNGNAHVPCSNSPDQDSNEEPSPTTPKVDKGKGRAEPEPEPHEPVLSPGPRDFLVGESEDEDEDGHRFLHLEDDGNNLASPTDRSRSWVEEEGEVFRRGNVLLGPAEMEGEYAGEELRKELLEAMVERPPPRVVDEYGTEYGLPAREDLRPSSPPLISTQEAKKPPPRPYISRTRSLETAVSSPTTGQQIPLQGPVSSTSSRPSVSPTIAGEF